MMNSSTIARTLQECSFLFGIEQISRRFVGRSEEEDGAQSRELSRSESGDGGTEVTNVLRGPRGKIANDGEGGSSQFSQIFPGVESNDCNTVKRRYQDWGRYF